VAPVSKIANGAFEIAQVKRMSKQKNNLHAPYLSQEP
jgi:hypothetical protein